VFASLDNTHSEPGRQYLYHLLRAPVETCEPLEQLERVVRELDSQPSTADDLRRELDLLDDPRAGQIANLILGELPQRPAGWWIFPLLTLLSVGCLALMAVWPRLFIVWVATCVVNLAVQFFYKRRVKQFVPALHELPAFVRAAGAIGKLRLAAPTKETATLRDGAAHLRPLRRATWWLMFEPGETNELAASIYEYINLLFLLDVNAFVFALASLRESQREMRSMFEAIGYLDAAQSIATWRTKVGRWTTPGFIPRRKALDVENVAHPLLAEPVPNSLCVDGASVLITGSNMSGKTTFVRALGVNAVLAQTLNTVWATKWSAPMLRVRTSIERADSVMEGKSYYLAEVESVRALVVAKETGAQHLFLLDEIFRGTNTTERVAAGYAVLDYLNRGDDLVVVATHDVEVIELLGDRYLPKHFREQIADGVLSFDYKIHEGPSSTRNAIALLEVMQFPSEIVTNALEAVRWERGFRGAK
jgi:DNA mismatch repair ATPase MutS